MSVYTVFREEHHNEDDVLVFTNRNAALNAMIRYMVSTGFVACAYGYKPDPEDGKPMRLYETVMVHPAKPFYMNEFMSTRSLSDEEVLNDPSLVYDALTIYV